MATFTDQEYADTSRIERGYYRFVKVYTPYAVDRSFGRINRAISVAERFFGIQEDRRHFRVVDGMHDALSESFNEQPGKAMTFLAEVVSTFSPRREKLDGTQLLIQLRTEASQSPTQSSMRYIFDPHTRELRGMVFWKDNDFYTASFSEDLHGNDQLYRHRIEDAWDSNARDPWHNGFGYATRALEELADRFESLSTGSVGVPEVFGEQDRHYDLIAIKDDGQTRDANLASLSADIRTETLAVERIQKMCLMITEPFMDPLFDASGNRPTNEKVSDDPDIYLDGNCVEVSVAVGLNQFGGINGRMLAPRSRQFPSTQLIRESPERLDVHSYDPLNPVTLADRCFSPVRIEKGLSLDQYGIGPEGASIGVPRHRVFVRPSEDGFDVYDAAIGFAGPWEDYTHVLPLMGSEAQVKAVSHVVALEPERVQFYRNLTSLYREDTVVSSLHEVIASIDPHKRYGDEINSYWNEALSRHPQHIARALSIDEGNIHAVDADDTGRISAVEQLTVKEMLDSQENGFVCFTCSPPKERGRPEYMVAFKQGDNQFVSYCFVGNSQAEVLDTRREWDDYVDRVVCFGGNDMARMQDIYSRGVDRAAQQSAANDVGR